MSTTSTLWSERGQAYANSSPHKYGPCLQKLLDLARPTSSDLCLDIGTGAGHTAARLAEHAHAVYGLDPAEGMRDAASRTYGHLPNLQFVPGYSHDTGFPDEMFDLVTARHTLHHHPSVPAFLTEAERILKPGGRLVIVDEITPITEIDTWYDQLERLRDPSHGRAYLMSEWHTFASASSLSWVVGDARTMLYIDVQSWLERINLGAEAQHLVREHLRNAPELAREQFNIRYKDNEAVSFEMPIAVILLTKPLAKEHA